MQVDLSLVGEVRRISCSMDRYQSAPAVLPRLAGEQCDPESPLEVSRVRGIGLNESSAEGVGPPATSDRAPPCYTSCEEGEVTEDRLQLAVDESRLADVCRRYKVRELALFGSVLRDDYTPTSDVDVLVEFEPGSPVRSLFDFIRVKQDLEDEVFHRQVDLIEQSTLHPLIASKVLRAKRTVYVTAH